MFVDPGSEGQTCLVTGGAGFIGSHLVEALLARGDKVFVLDNLSTGRLENLASVIRHPRLVFAQGSVLDRLMVDELMMQSDTVVHLAAAVGVRLIVDQPLKSFTTNIQGSETVIESAHRFRRRILLASTSEIYGKNGGLALTEDANRILGPPSIARWAYSTAKAVDEIFANCYYRERGLPTTVVRLFNTVGPRQSADYGMVIPRLFEQAVGGDPITVYGDGLQTRCFCHVTDIVDGILRLLDHPGSVGETFNLGSQEETSILELANRIRALTASPSPITLVPYQVAFPSGFEDMERRVPDTTKVRSLTGWHPTRSLDQILEEVGASMRPDRIPSPAPLA